MSLIMKTARSPIAVAVLADQLIAVQLVRFKKDWKPAVTVSIRRDAPAVDPPSSTLTDDELTALERALARQGATGREMALLAPSGVTSVELLELPPRTAEMPIEQLARAEMARLARWDDATPFQVTTWDVPPPQRRAAGEATTSLYAAAVTEASIQPLIAQLWSRGWSVGSVIPAPCAAASLVSDGSKSDGTSLTVVVDLQADRAALTLIRASTPIYHRELPDNGFALLVRGMVADLTMSASDAAAAIEHGSVDLGQSNPRLRNLCESFSEALAGELEASLAFAARRYGEVRLGELLLVGMGARIGGLADWLRARLDIAASLTQSAADPTIAMCVALARTATQRSCFAGLLPAPQVELVAKERIAHHWLTGAAAVAVFTLAGVAALYAWNASPTSSDESRLTSYGREQVRAEAEIAGVRRSLADVHTRLNFEKRLTQQPDYSNVFRLLGGALDDATVLREISLDDAGPQTAAAITTPSAVSAKPKVFRRLKLNGTAPAASALTAQVASLRSLDVFSNVELARTSRSADGEGVSFDLTFELVAPAVEGSSPAKGVK